MCYTASGPALLRPTSTDACKCSSAEEMAGCERMMRLRVMKSGDLMATRKTLAGFRVPAFFRGVLSLRHRSSLTAEFSLRWDRALATATDLHLFMQSVPTAR